MSRIYRYSKHCTKNSKQKITKHQKNVEKLQIMKQNQESLVNSKKEKYEMKTAEFLELSEFLKQSPKSKDLEKVN
jgi:hypothetical protein